MCGPVSVRHIFGPAYGGGMDLELITTVAVVLLCAAAGLRAYPPLLALGVGADLGITPLHAGYGWLARPEVIAGLAMMAGVEFLADKVPGVDHMNDGIHTLVRPISGALIFATSSNLISDHSLPAAVLASLALAGSTHAIKAGCRPVVTATTAGIGNPFLSLIEDAAVAGMLILAFVLPLVALAGTVLFLLLAGRVALDIAGSRQRRPPPPASMRTP